MTKEWGTAPYYDSKVCWWRNFLVTHDFSETMQKRLKKILFLFEEKYAACFFLSNNILDVFFLSNNIYQSQN